MLKYVMEYLLSFIKDPITVLLLFIRKLWGFVFFKKVGLFN
jgi:hypothetical protein